MPPMQQMEQMLPKHAALPQIVEGDLPGQLPPIEREPAGEIKVLDEDDAGDLFGQMPEMGKPELPAGEHPLAAENPMAALQQLFGEGGAGHGLHDILETFGKLFESLAKLEEATHHPADPVVVEPLPVDVEAKPEVVPPLLDDVDPGFANPALDAPQDPQHPGMVLF